ncbi:MAG: hypothetical protein WBA88_18885 [Pseudaminobacter sp.]
MKSWTKGDDPIRQAEALRALATTDSVVDLLALVGTIQAADDPDLWNRAVNSRLEAILAEKMRKLIAGDDQQDAAA